MLTPDQQAVYTANTAAEVAQLNQNLKTFYLGAFNNLLVSVLAHAIQPSTVNWPSPPLAFVVSPPDSNGFTYAVLGTTIVCNQPAIPPDNSNPPLVANTIDIGAALGGGWYAAGPMDTWPPNKQTPPVTLPDGLTHTFMKIPAPVGSHIITLPDGTVVVQGGWYEVVS